MHNRPGLVLGVILLIMAVMLTYRNLTREPFELAERKGHQASREDYAAGREGRTPTFPIAFPLACTLGEDCWIGRYMDRGIGADVQDFMCKASTQNGHKGTDFAIADLSRMAEGVAVLAAASGKVARLRDGMADVSVDKVDEGALDGRECGNAVVIDHIGGWQTQYCHMKKGSIQVVPGQNVSAGDKIGEIGLSGQTEYPHLHFSLRHNKMDIDPFDGGHFEQGCDTEKDPLWRERIDYRPVTLMPAQFSANPQDKASRWKAGADTLKAEGPGLILTARIFHARTGDTLTFTIKDPTGETFAEKAVTIDQNRQILTQYFGKKRPIGGFKHGTWRGEIVLRRDGMDDQTQTAEVSVLP
ncbi:MAG: M23 family metallopeptidase [Alphaproteobacteria bacterium]|nr:M23 family metallopeptidase [Alphaproteobacteria bacterium]